MDTLYAIHCFATSCQSRISCSMMSKQSHFPRPSILFSPPNVKKDPRSENICEIIWFII